MIALGVGAGTIIRACADERCDPSASCSECFIVSVVMTASPHHRRATLIASRCVGVLFTLACAIAFLPTAQASCGDWLAGHAANAAPEASVDHNRSDASVDHSSRQRRRPCQGASCGRTPSLPAAPTSLPTRLVEHDRDAVLASVDATDAAGPVVRISSDPVIAREVLSERLDRPPRHG